MPYIKPEQRKELDEYIGYLSKKIYLKTKTDDLEGVMNYVLTSVLTNTYKLFYEQISYSCINNMMGILGCMSQELYRRLASWYEDLKIMKNGDLSSFRDWNDS